MNEADINAGQAIYTPLLLKLYDIWVLEISNRWIWRCSKYHQLKQYRRHITSNHLDIGVGTGYYLKQCKWPKRTCLSLMDLNANCLATAKRATQGLSPVLYLSDIFKPQLLLAEKFDSISLNYLLHCLPGNMITKSMAVANAVSMLKPGCVLFGATILADDNLHTPISRRLSAFYNQKRVFSNQYDTLDALKTMLTQYLDGVDIEIIGCVALFSGYKKAH